MIRLINFIENLLNMMVCSEIREKLANLPTKTVILLYLASRYSPEEHLSWVYYKDIIEFIEDVKGVYDRIVHNVLAQLCRYYGFVNKRKISKTEIYYRISEKGLRWLRWKIYVDRSIPEELKVPAIDLVRIKVDGKII